MECGEKKELLNWSAQEKMSTALSLVPISSSAMLPSLMEEKKKKRE